MSDIPQCLCCGCDLSDPSAAIYGWCSWCAGAVLHELLSMGDLKPGDITILADIFRTVQAPTCAKVITRVPFEITADKKTLSAVIP